MRKCLWISFAFIAACGFGDNHAINGGPTRHACGDTVVDQGEGCDDGNTTSGDGCSESCEVEVPDPVCGNGVREVGEACDDGNHATGDGCSDTCTVESVCGNGHLEQGEACDDGNLASGDGCSPMCTIETATACMLVPQGGCGGATPACDIDQDGNTECRGVTVQGTSNSHCVAQTECKTGYTCIGETGSTLPAWCTRFCIHDSDCSGAGSRCLIGLDNANGDPINVTVCTNSCNPAAQTGCPSQMACQGYNGTPSDFTDCQYPGTALAGQSCTNDHDCATGDACVSSGGVKTCHRWCYVGDATSCPAQKFCIGFSDPVMVGGIQYGVCQ
jgi:cysteine-rich repeat protein